MMKEYITDFISCGIYVECNSKIHIQKSVCNFEKGAVISHAGQNLESERSVFIFVEGT